MIERFQQFRASEGDGQPFLLGNAYVVSFHVWTRKPFVIRCRLIDSVIGYAFGRVVVERLPFLLVPVIMLLRYFEENHTTAR